MPGIPPVARTWPLEFSPMRAPRTPTDVENPRLVAVNRNGPIFVDLRNLHATLFPCPHCQVSREYTCFSLTRRLSPRVHVLAQVHCY